MSGHHYLLSFLPSLGDLGAAAPMSVAALVETVRFANGPVWTVEVPALSWDLQQRDSFLAGELKHVAPAVLTEEQIRGESPLPSFLAAGEAAAQLAMGVDAVWDSYYRYAFKQAARHHSNFLKKWLRSELSLRNALVELRAKQLGLDAALYLVARDLHTDDGDWTTLLAEWSAAPSPLAGLRVLEQGRWQWLLAHENWFAFNDDELAVYATKMLALIRWHRLTETPADAAAASPAK